ncbi:PDZ domain-containing protein [Paludibacter sp. 221]|uniref:S41 family peptidase n=1 Tax=Paludibacter sp. 221 TaxID=2302939 RepID=UPI0013D75475|nr:S41 family peptidase [Paludibacter sp. 221]NDV47382.1 PDZ domain-containing protein [Paludibacter sp. 221]
MKISFPKTGFLLYLSVFLLFFASCDNNNEPSDVTTVTKKVNNFIHSTFKEVYLWDKYLPSINPNKEADSFAYFDKLVYKDDKWSMLTDKISDLQDSFYGEDTTFGYSLVIYRFSNSDTYFAVVQFVYPDSPADNAGVKRGDIIMTIDGNDITAANYLDLYYASSIKLGIGEVGSDRKLSLAKTVSLNAVKQYMNPVMISKVIEAGGKKVGYLLYTSFLLKSHRELQEAITGFKNMGVTDVVLDLRYNGGGTAVTSQLLCSMLVNEEAFRNKSVFLQQVWNDGYMEYFKYRGEETNEYFVHEYKSQNADESVVVDNINLSTIYILTGNGTASASEATIIGLKPYLDVVLIGETTSGKYCGGVLLEPENIGIKDSDLYDWGMYIMVYRFANKNGFPALTDVSGIAPNYYVEEDIITNPVALGEQNEPLLAKAIELITGQSGVQQSPSKTRMLDRKLVPADLKIPLKPLDEKMIDTKAVVIPSAK